MSDADSPPAGLPDSLERERWESDRAFREREIAIKEREQEHKASELELARTERTPSPWRSPLVVAILAAAVAALGNAFVAYTNANSQTELEAQKAEQQRILEMMKTGGSPDAAAVNLKFLLQAGLISDPGIRRDLARFLDDRKKGTGPSLPSPSGAANLISQFDSGQLKPYNDIVGVETIGIGHVLTKAELRSGTIVIGGRRIPFRVGLTAQQAKQLLAQDLAPYRKEIKRQIKVPLTPNQLDALTSFVYNVGTGALKGTGLARTLNAGKYDEVPRELMKWTKAGGRTLPSLVAQRRGEVALWNRK
jgi:GH24 family phage-related lysozyme (muramidase)